jgi:repressor LexA
MHVIQEKLLKLSRDYDLMNMKLLEIGQLIDVDHPQKIKHHRGQLVKNGYLSKKSAIQEENRGLLGAADLISIPIMGSANAGPATIYADNLIRGYLRISSSLLKSGASLKDLFALEVVGNSMNQAQVNGNVTIDNGDYIIADKKAFNPKSGDYVVSLIDGMANIKKVIFDKPNHQIVLMSESSDNFPPIFIHMADSVDYVVQAKVVQVVKTPKIT